MNFTSFLAELPDHVVFWGAFAGIAGLTSVAAVGYFRFRKARPRRMFTKRLDRIARAHLHDITVSDGLGGVIQIDRLLLTTDRLLVLDVKNFDGMIFGNAALDTWTQVLGSKNYPFANPVSENRVRVQAIKTLVPGVPVMGCVMFTDSAQFPKGRPQGVYTLDNLHEALVPLEKETGGDSVRRATRLRAAWDKIKEAARAEERMAKR